MLREAVTNVIRHSAATECMITIEVEPALRMIITNDGASPVDEDHRGHGLIGMRERVTSVGGTLDTWATPESGRFTVEVNVPRPAGSRS